MAAGVTLPFCSPYDFFFTRNICAEDDKDRFYTDYLLRYWGGYVASARWTGLLIYCVVVVRSWKALRFRVLFLFIFGLFHSSKHLAAPTVLSCCYDFYYIEYIETLCVFIFQVITGVLVLFGVLVTASLLQSTINLYERSPLADRSFYFAVSVIVVLLMYPFMLHFSLYMSIYDLALTYIMQQHYSSQNLEGAILFIVSILLFFAYCYWFLRAVVYLSLKEYRSPLNGIYVPTAAINIYSLCLTLQSTSGDWAISYFAYCELGALLQSFIYWWIVQSERTVTALFLDDDEFLSALDDCHGVMDYAPQYYRRAFFTRIYHRALKRLERQCISHTKRRAVIHTFARHIFPYANVNSYTRRSHFHALDVVIQTQDWELFLALHRAGAAYRLPLSDGRTFAQTLEEKVEKVEWPLSMQDEVWVRIHSFLSAYRNNVLFLLWLHARNISRLRRLPLELVREVHSFL